MRDYEITNNATAAASTTRPRLGSEVQMAKESGDSWAPARRFHPVASETYREPVRFSFYSHGGKRAFDLFVSVVGLVMLGIPITVITLAIGWLDGFPVFFRQKRVGRHGRLFTICKFRTMRTATGSASSITTAVDARVTPIGRWLRRFKLDELPQLWNVLRGEMSFVGPRPDVEGYLDRLDGDATALWELRPGITGPATLLFRREEELLASINDYVRFNDEVVFPEKIRLNLAYMRRISFMIDLGYILATVAPSLSRGLGADRYLGLHYETFESRMKEAGEKYSSQAR